MDSLIKRLSILPRWIIILIDFSLIAFSSLLAYSLRFNFSIDELVKFDFVRGVFTYSFLGFLSVLLTGSYSGIVRYTGIADGVRVLYATLLNLVLALALNFIFLFSVGENFIPVSVLATSFFISFLILFCYRLLVKNIFTYYLEKSRDRKNVIIYGSGQAALVAQQVLENSGLEFKVVGFVESDGNKVGKYQGGLRIYPVTSVHKLFKNKNISELIISNNETNSLSQKDLIDESLKHGVKVRQVPPINHWVNGELSLNQIRKLKIEDLLGREVIKVDSPEVESTINYKTVMVTGAAGSIGSELVRQLACLKVSKLVLVDQSETTLYDQELFLRLKFPSISINVYLADVTNEVRIDSLVAEIKPNVVFHAAAYKHVPVMESNPTEAILCNVKGTINLANSSIRYGVERFVFISTDKAVRPTSLMGCTKRISEMYIQALNGSEANRSNTLFITTRFGNVLGSNGSVIPRFKKQIDEGGPVTVTHPEITRYFMTISEACNLVLEAAAMGKGGEVYVFDMGESVKIVDLAKKMVRLSGLEVEKDIEIKFTGLREGEKLYEELLGDKENTIPTHHEKIMCAKLTESNFEETKEYTGSLIQHAINNDIEKVIKLMKFLVPDFSPQNEIYKNILKQPFNYPNRHSA